MMCTARLVILGCQLRFNTGQGSLRWQVLSLMTLISESSVFMRCPNMSELVMCQAGLKPKAWPMLWALHGLRPGSVATVATDVFQ